MLFRKLLIGLAFCIAIQICVSYVAADPYAITLKASPNPVMIGQFCHLYSQSYGTDLGWKPVYFERFKNGNWELVYPENSDGMGHSETYCYTPPLGEFDTYRAVTGGYEGGYRNIVSNLVIVTSIDNPDIPPVADLTATSIQGTNSPWEVQFTDLSTGQITSWEWDFGDNSQSTSQNPRHSYLNPGCYPVTLRVVGPYGSDEITKSRDLVKIGVDTCGPINPLVAAFEATPTSGAAPLKVIFNDQSTGDITSREWQYKLNTESTWNTFTLDNDASFTFTNPGTYDVQLIVRGSGDPSTKSISITVTPQTTTGIVSFDQPDYTEFAGVKWIYVTDPDMNTDPTTEETIFVDIDVVDAIDQKIIDQKVRFQLHETDKNSGIFRAGFLCTNVPPSGGLPTDGQYVYINPAHQGVFLVRYLDPVDANGVANQLQTAQVIYDFSLHVTVTAGGRFIFSNPDQWSGSAGAPLHVQVKQANNPISGAEIRIKDGYSLGVTDSNGILDSSVIIGDYFTDPDPVIVVATKDELTGASDPVKPYSIFKIFDPKEYKVTSKDRYFYDTYIAGRQVVNGFTTPRVWIMQILGFVPGVGDIIGIAGAANDFLDLFIYFNYYTNYIPREDDIIHFDLVEYTNDPVDVSPAYVVSIKVFREGQLITSRSIWFDDRDLAEEITSKWRLLIRLDSPAVVYVTSPDGKHVGYDSSSNELTGEIPAVIGNVGDEPFTLYLPYLNQGKYKIDVIGTGMGTYTLTTRSINSVGVEQEHSFTGSITKDEIDSYQAVYSNTGEIVISPANQPPIPDAGTDQTVTVNTLVTIDGTGSTDPDNNLPLTYVWNIANKPSGSTAVLSSTTTAKPTFTPDKTGDYIISLTVTDNLGLASTTADSLKITAIAANQPPVPVKVKILPNPLNIATKGYFIAFVTLPKEYKATDVDASSVKCQEIAALKLVRSKWFPQTFVAIFSREKLSGLPLGNTELTVTGTINKNGKKVGFSGANTIKVISKITKTKEPIDDVMKLSDDKVFSHFNPG